MTVFIVIYNLFKDFFIHQKYRKYDMKQQPNVDQMNYACEVYLTPVKQRFMQSVVYTANVALMVRYRNYAMFLDSKK